MLTGSQSGVYYPVGVAPSRNFATDIPNVRTTTQVTRASAENPILLQASRGEAAFNPADARWQGGRRVRSPQRGWPVLHLAHNA